MKRTTKLIVNDGEKKIEMNIKQTKSANCEAWNVKNDFSNFVDSIVEILLKNYHFSDIKIIKN